MGKMVARICVGFVILFLLLLLGITLVVLWEAVTNPTLLFAGGYSLLPLVVKVTVFLLLCYLIGWAVERTT